jgi:membrane protein implicated in regulation of membrane protease activity
MTSTRTKKVVIYVLTFVALSAGATILLLDLPLGVRFAGYLIAGLIVLLISAGALRRLETPEGPAQPNQRSAG